MEEKKKNNDKMAIIIFSIILVIIFVPIIISSISNSVSESREFNHETKLIQEGKTESTSEVLDRIIKALKDRNEDDFEKLLSKDFSYWDNDNHYSKDIKKFWKDLRKISGKYYMEQRGNSIKEHETYWIYWNIPEKANYNEYTENYQQRIMIYLKKVVKEDIITYEIEKIILKDNQ